MGGEAIASALAGQSWSLELVSEGKSAAARDPMPLTRSSLELVPTESDTRGYKGQWGWLSSIDVLHGFRYESIKAELSTLSQRQYWDPRVWRSGSTEGHDDTQSDIAK